MPKNKKQFPLLVGVVHLPALPGSPNARAYGSAEVDRIAQLAVREALLFESEGFDGVILENFGDIPFYKDRVPPATTAAMTKIAVRTREKVRISIGINVLRNDARAALAIAQATGCQFIRVNVLSGVAATDQGLIEGCAATLMRERAGSSVQVWGDVLVKHARPLSGDEIELAAEEVALRAMADAIILTGPTTGRPVDMQQLRRVAELGLRAPLYLGSGVTPENIGDYREFADGVIIGSALREHGRAGAPLERVRVRKFARATLAL